MLGPSLSFNEKDSGNVNLFVPDFPVTNENKPPEMNCTLEPWTPGCESYELPEAEATLAVGKLCGMMDWMPGCAVAKVCEATPSLLLCNPFSLLADICRFDMPGMKSCFEYKNMCNTKDSIIRQCREYPPLPYLPTTKEAKQLVQSICTEMRMDGCELCPLSNTISINGIPQCDWFTIYSGLCNAMPDMSQVSIALKPPISFLTAAEPYEVYTIYRPLHGNTDIPTLFQFESPRQSKYSKTSHQ
ncbi:hypothetical protein BDR26DRAFT_661854 [Obelidium mucronatum]|nr:hypothetical protein BDR26DRAFT_661854 [Obelidium mucronatum]